MRKIYKYIGSLFIVGSPLVAIISCSENSNQTNKKIGDSSKGIKITDKGDVKLKTNVTSLIGRKLSISNPFKDISKMQKNTKDYFANGYWSKLIKSSGKDKQFNWVAEQTKSVNDIVSMMDDQLHFKFKKSLSNMKPLDFANYIANLYINNGGGKWSFTVSYKGHSDVVSIDTSNVLEKFLRSLDGQGTPVSFKSKRGTWGMMGLGLKTIGKLDIGSLTNMQNKYKDTVFSGLDMKGVYDLLYGVPAESTNIFPEFLELFVNLGAQFKKSPTAQLWLKDQDENVKKQFKNLETEIIKIVLNSGS